MPSVLRSIFADYRSNSDSCIDLGAGMEVEAHSRTCQPMIYRQ
jgi:hypothetical protein